MDSIDALLLSSKRKCRMLPWITSGNIFVRHCSLEGFDIRHGEETLLDLQNLHYPQNYVLDPHVCTCHRVYFLCHRNEPLK